MGSPGSLPWVAWADNFGGLGGSPSGVPGAVFCNPDGPIRIGHDEAHIGGARGATKGLPCRATGVVVGCILRVAL